jgi:hypothetical protein
MSLATDPLPANLSALRIFAADLQAELARKDIEIAANAAEIHAKTLHIEQLKRSARWSGSASRGHASHSPCCGSAFVSRAICSALWPIARCSVRMSSAREARRLAGLAHALRSRRFSSRSAAA